VLLEHTSSSENRLNLSQSDSYSDNPSDGYSDKDVNDSDASPNNDGLYKLTEGNRKRLLGITEIFLTETENGKHDRVTIYEAMVPAASLTFDPYTVNTCSQTVPQQQIFTASVEPPQRNMLNDDGYQPVHLQAASSPETNWPAQVSGTVESPSLRQSGIPEHCIVQVVISGW
jgi:hypothetical protein